MGELLERFVPMTIGLRIIEMLDRNGEMVFSQIRKELDKINDGTLSRELLTLMNTTPPTILKTGEKRSSKYALNYEHPELPNLLAVVHLHTHRSETLHIFDAGFDNGEPFASFTVITPSAPRLDEAIAVEMRDRISTRDGNQLPLEAELMVLIESIMNAKLRAYIYQAIKEGKVKQEEVILFDGEKKAPNMDNATVLELLHKVQYEDLTIQINSLFPRYKNK
ncbi:hypothetical protein [Gudongella sp.]|uniref:hypothetical protein n=1 Tax=uncultured Methanomethylovorans sp. TaxID=183759 RepID=UPI00261F3C9D|nr:hypothetical protein [uncultured Methanomethylovorans sp.]